MADDVEIVRAAYEAFNRGDESFLEYLDPEVEFIPAAQFVEGPVHGIDELRHLLDTFNEAFDEIQWVPVRIEEGRKEGEVVVVLDVHTRGRGSGAEVTVRVAHHVQVRDGKLIWGKVYPKAEEGLQAAGLKPDA